jgi:hypothetical protein
VGREIAEDYLVGGMKIERGRDQQQAWRLGE